MYHSLYINAPCNNEERELPCARATGCHFFTVSCAAPSLSQFVRFEWSKN